MSSESEDPGTLNQPVHTRQELEKNVKFSYTRDFLLSLSASDACKKLPSGFDKSILSEFEDAFNGHDRPRPSGGLSVQSFRRIEYGSSPPFRGDSSNYSRGTHGKWDSRSRDSDSQSDRDSDSGRRYGNLSRQSWQNEHDGLLGSGSFPKSSGFVSGTSPSKFQAHERFQLSRSNAPYQPPRPYKAVPHTRRDGKDSHNDETFGSAECASEDQAEEERKRRASFELMRKEHHRAFQEKQAADSDKPKKSDFSWMEDSKDDKKHPGGATKSDESLLIPASEIDSSKSLLSSQASASRPLVPPGFKSTILEKQTGSKSAIPSRSTEVGTSVLSDRFMHNKGSALLDTPSDNENVKRLGDRKDLGELQPVIMSTHVPFVKNPGDILNSTTEDEKRIGMTNSFQQFKTSGLPETDEALLSGEFMELDSEKRTRQTMEAQPTSILEKLFGSSLSVSSSEPSISEHLDSKVEDALSPSMGRSSKFAHWFHEDENTSLGDVSSTRSNNLLSLIGGGEKGGILTSDAKVIDTIAPIRAFHSSEAVNEPKTSVTVPTPARQQVKIHGGSKQEPVPVLTCEDLEQSLLSEVSEQKSVMETPLQGWNALDTKKEQPKAGIDNLASQHLLSLLQKGSEPEDIVTPSSIDVRSLEKHHVSNIASMDTTLDNLKEGKLQKNPDANKTLTLEALFGPAFMKELQSAESYGQPVPKMGNGPSPVDESNVLLLNHLQQTEMDKEHHLGFDGLRSHLDPSNLQSELGFTLGGLDRRVGYQLSEEGRPTSQPNPLFALGGNSGQREVSLLKRPVDAPEKLGALSAIFKDERSMVSHQDDHPLTHDFYDMFETKLPYQNVHAQPSPHFHPPHMNHGRPMFNSSDMQLTHNTQLEFPERMIHRDTPPGHQFSPNIFPPSFHHPEMRTTAFDSPAHHHILQQMHMPGHFPPPHLTPEFPVGATRPHHPSNQVFGFRHEPNRFPAGHQQPGFGGLGMSPPVGVGGMGGGLGNNHPEALQRLLDMELRSNPKPTHPFPGGPLGSLNL